MPTDSQLTNDDTRHRKIPNAKQQIPKKSQIAADRDECTTSRGIASKLKILNFKYFLAFEHWRL